MLETRTPREQSGRDSFSRYKAQTRSAAIAALEILQGDAVDRVYCDFHDDFVVRLQDEQGIRYHFFQVKTKAKANHLWSLAETFGLKSRLSDPSKQSTDKIKDSHVGKLLLHTVIWEDYCHAVTFQTNIHLHDEVISLLEDIKSGTLDSKYSSALISKFNECFFEDLWCPLSEERIKENLGKLQFVPDVQYLKQKNNGFEMSVREHIYNFSEIDLETTELKEIILKLLDLVEKKSCGVIHKLSIDTIEESAGISIDDLLSVLSISKDAYDLLIAGGDRKAVKSASIIQRLLTNAEAGPDEIEYASRCKSEWDTWRRLNRHQLTELNLNAITQEIRLALEEVIGKNNFIVLSDLKSTIVKLSEKLAQKNLLYDLNENLLVGGIFSEMVRGR